MNTLGFVLFLATRNVRRYWKKSLQTFAIIFAGAFCIMLVDAFMRGFSDSTVKRIVSQSGHADAHAPGYLDSEKAYPLDLPVRGAEGVERAMLAAAASGLPGTRAIAAASISTAGMLSNGDKSVPGGIYGAEAFALDSGGGRTIPNPALAQAGERLSSGAFFSSPDDRGAIVDEKLAKKLGLSPGSRLVILGTDAYGSFGMAELAVLGIAREGSLPEGALCLADIASLASALGMEGNSSAVALWVGREGAAGFEAIAPERAEAATLAAVAAAAGAGLEARPFSSISAEYSALFDFLDYFMLGMMIVFALVAGAGMANAILLSVQDRTKDLGTLRAIALSSRGTGFLVAAETFIVGTAAAAAAFLVGLAAVWVLERTGFSIGFELASNSSGGFPDALRPRLMPGRLGLIALVCGAFPLLAALLPIRIASRLTVREALSA